MSSKSATTFRVSEKTPARHCEYVDPLEGFTNMPQYNENNCEEILQATPFPPGSAFSNNGFIKTVVDCYIKHHNLIFRPDDVWAALMTQFSFYINKNAEELRKNFVAFEGKKELVVEIPGTLRTAPYDLFVKKMTEKIDENLVDPEVKKWILPNFSTTTDNDLVTIGVVFMAAMKEYFEYSCRYGCGIPSITLDGTVEDWKSIRERVGKLKEYQLEKWHDMLTPILDQFVNAKEGIVDLDFWQRICHYQRGGSGTASVVTGWITVFSPFDKDGNWLESVSSSRLPKWIKLEEDQQPRWPWLDIRDVPTGIVEVEVKLKDISDGKEYKSIMFAGHMGVELLDKGRTLKPMLGWVIALTEKPAKKKESDSEDEHDDDEDDVDDLFY